MSRKKLGFGIFLIGFVLFLFEIFLNIKNPGDNIMRMITKPMVGSGIEDNKSILFLASMGSWAIPIIFMFVGAIIAKSSKEKNERDFFDKK